VPCRRTDRICPARPGDCATITGMGAYDVVVGAGTLRSSTNGAVVFGHRWTSEGVTVDAAFTGAHLLHVAVAGCVLNDVYREAAARGIALRGVRVSATGDFRPETWESSGITYVTEVDADAPPTEIDQLVQAVDAVAEIPKAIRLGAGVQHAPR
jgi:uncharacterized OsmC-like protein